MTCAHSQAALFAMGSSAFDVLDIASASIGKVTHLVGCIDDDVQHLVAPLHVVEIAAHLLSNHVVPDTLSPSLPSPSPVVWAERSWWTMDGRGVIAAATSSPSSLPLFLVAILAAAVASSSSLSS